MTVQPGLYMAWKGMDNDPGIYWSHFDGAQWAPQRQVSGVGTSFGPALSVHSSDALLMVWKGAGSDESIYFSRFDGANWLPQRRFHGVGTSIATSSGPALSPDEVGTGAGYMAWKGAGGDNSIYVAAWAGARDSGAELEPRKMDGLTSTSPALGFSSSVPYLAWKGAGADQGIYWTRQFTDWEPQHRIEGVGTSSGPSLSYAGFGTQTETHMAWKGMDGDQGIYSSHFDGARWAPQQRVGGATSSGPALAKEIRQPSPYRGMFMAWKGVEGDPRIFWSHFDSNSTRWAPEQQVGGVATSSRPALIWVG